VASQALIVVSRSPEDNAARRAFEDAVIARLKQTAAAPVVVVPHVYNLHPSDAVATRLAEMMQEGGADRTAIVAARLHPRATRWTLSALGCADAEKVSAIDLREFESADACAAALADLSGAAGGEVGGAATEDLTGDAPARWYPVLDYDRCAGCRQCMDFCLFGVFSLDDGGRVRASQPDNCKPGCPACARVCPAGAIMFPHYHADPTIAGSDEAAKPDHARHAAAESGRDGAGGDAGDELDNLIDALDDLDDS